MPRHITLSRAARLVGVKRATLQKRIRSGELRTFEGELLLSDLLQAYPQAEIDDTSMIDRVELIMEQAVNKIIRPDDETPDPATLAARILALAQELDDALLDVKHYRDLVNRVKLKLDELESRDAGQPAESISALREWFLHDLESLEAARDAADNPAREIFRRIEAARVRILPSGNEFCIEGSDTLLEAGLRAGLALNYGCSTGTCGLCKCKLISGQVKRIRLHDYRLTETEKGLGYLLACCNTALTDVVLDAAEAHGSSDIPAQEIEVRVKKIEQPDEGVILLHAKTPRTKRLRFLAGQYLSLESSDTAPQECSIASCPCDDMNLQFHIPYIRGNPFCDVLVNQLRTNSSITIRGPRGSFSLAKDSNRSLVFLACDTGFGPVKSLIEHAMSMDNAEKIDLYWITTPGNSHYLGNLCRSWDDALDNFTYTALKADAAHSVESLLPEIFDDLADAEQLDYYLCMPEEILEGVEKYLLQRGIAAAHIKLEPLRRPQDPACDD